MKVPDHVPAEIVREVNLDFRGPMDEMLARLDALRLHGRVLWVEGLSGTGAWLFTRAADIRTALQSPQLLSNRFSGFDSAPTMIPVSLDPPEHTRWRRLLNPLFAPQVVGAMEDSMRRRMRGIVAELAPSGACDFVADVAVQFPTRVFTSWIGLPEDDTPRFVRIVSSLLHDSDPAARGVAVTRAYSALNQLVDDRMASPGDDLISVIAGLEYDGRPLTKDELLKIAFFLFLAGLDTVAAALSFSFWQLAQSPQHRRRIATGDVGTERVVEELLRRHSFLNLPRIVARDVEFAGVRLRRGDPVVLSLALASRDPEEYRDAAAVDFDRDDVRHYAFGLGPHRCIGSHLARLELRVAMQEWHSRIPDYVLDGEVEGYAGLVMGATNLPLRWG